MNLWKRLVAARRSLSITTKFIWAFIALLLLIAIVALTGFVSLRAVRSEAHYAIDAGIKMQRLVFEMDAELRNARRLERDFFFTLANSRFFPKPIRSTFGNTNEQLRMY